MCSVLVDKLQSARELRIRRVNRPYALHVLQEMVPKSDDNASKDTVSAKMFQRVTGLRENASLRENARHHILCPNDNVS